jgi:hypothetical protein
VAVVYAAAEHVGAVSPVVNEELDEESPFKKPRYVLLNVGVPPYETEVSPGITARLALAAVTEVELTPARLAYPDVEGVKLRV